MTECGPIIYRRASFLSYTALGLSAFLITCVASCTVVVVYGIHVASDKTEDLFALAERTVQALPELAESLPPAVADLLNDHRDPAYAGQLEVRARLAERPDGRGVRTVLEVVNKGEQVVSLLSLRVTVLDTQGRLLHEANEWAATPLAADRGWPGPLMPGSHRRVGGSYCWPEVRGPLDELTTEVEITDIRLWNGDPQEPAALDPAA